MCLAFQAATLVLSLPWLIPVMFDMVAQMQTWFFALTVDMLGKDILVFAAVSMAALGSIGDTSFRLLTESHLLIESGILVWPKGQVEALAS